MEALKYGQALVRNIFNQETADPGYIVIELTEQVHDDSFENDNDIDLI